MYVFVTHATNSRNVDSVRYMWSWKIKMIKVLRVHVVIVYLVAILCEVKDIIPESTRSNCVTPSMVNSRLCRGGNNKCK
jgi:hypothetical protein